MASAISSKSSIGAYSLTMCEGFETQRVAYFSPFLNATQKPDFIETVWFAFWFESVWP